MKVIVTHLSIDLDAAASCWLIKRFLPGWENALVKFVPAGQTIDGKPPDEDPQIIHVDTGRGKFDHHQTDKFTCAAKLVFSNLLKQKFIPSKYKAALEKIVDYVNETDHFFEVFWPQPQSDYYDFCLHQIVPKLKTVFANDRESLIYSFSLLDVMLNLFNQKILAQREILRSFTFTCKFGLSLAAITSNHDLIKIALKQGYHLVITKDKKKGGVRIKTLPERKYNLTALYQKIISTDKKGDWYLHPSKNMLLNATSKNPHLKPTHLTLARLIEIIKSV